MEKALKFLKHMKQTDTPYNFRECELDEAIAELEEAMKPKTCEWKYADNGDSEWFGKCGAVWSFFDASPLENGMKFCPQCGGKIIYIEPKDNA